MIQRLAAPAARDDAQQVARGHATPSAWHASPRMLAQRQRIEAQFGPGKGVTQRYLDVTRPDLFLNPQALETPECQLDIPQFANFQRFLADIGRTKPHLDALNDDLLGQPQLLSAQLAQAEGGPLLRMVQGIEAEDFLDVVSQGIRFEDWVDMDHGVQTHRIQWYLLRKEFGADVDRLYARSADAVFKVKGKFAKSIWDLVVDSTWPDGPHDFTMPERLQTYLRETYQPEARQLLAKVRRLLSRGHPPLRAAMVQESAEFAAKRDAMRADAPKPKQPNMPGPLENKHGIWSGWKRAREDEETVWTASIVEPSIGMRWDESEHRL